MNNGDLFSVCYYRNYTLEEFGRFGSDLCIHRWQVIFTQTVCHSNKQK